MKSLLVLSLFLLIAACGSPQPETDPAINISIEDITPSGVNAPNLTAGIDMANQNVCRANMLTAAASITLYKTQHSELPSSVAGYGSCPDGGSYEYLIEGQSWTLKCPANPSHGYIIDGTDSW